MGPEECTEEQHQGLADNAAEPDPNNCMICWIQVVYACFQSTTTDINSLDKNALAYKT